MVSHWKQFSDGQSSIFPKKFLVQDAMIAADISVHLVQLFGDVRDVSRPIKYVSHLITNCDILSKLTQIIAHYDPL